MFLCCFFFTRIVQDYPGALRAWLPQTPERMNFGVGISKICLFCLFVFCEGKIRRRVHLFATRTPHNTNRVSHPQPHVFRKLKSTGDRTVQVHTSNSQSCAPSFTSHQNITARSRLLFQTSTNTLSSRNIVLCVHGSKYTFCVVNSVNVVFLSSFFSRH